MKALDIKINPKEKAVFDSMVPQDGVLSPNQFEKLRNYLDKEFFGSGFKKALDTAMKRGADMTDSKIIVDREFKDALLKISSDSVKELVAKIPENL